MSNVIFARNLTKNFRNHKAIQNLNFSVEKGEILCFLGPSGSGKTTTINIFIENRLSIVENPKKPIFWANHRKT